MNDQTLPKSLQVRNTIEFYESSYKIGPWTESVSNRKLPPIFSAREDLKMSEDDKMIRNRKMHIFLKNKYKERQSNESNVMIEKSTEIDSSFTTNRAKIKSHHKYNIDDYKLKTIKNFTLLEECEEKGSGKSLIKKIKNKSPIFESSLEIGRYKNVERLKLRDEISIQAENNLKIERKIYKIMSKYRL